MNECHFAIQSFFRNDFLLDLWHIRPRISSMEVSQRPLYILDNKEPRKSSQIQSASILPYSIGTKTKFIIFTNFFQKKSRITKLTESSEHTNNGTMANTRMSFVVVLFHIWRPLKKNWLLMSSL